MPPRVEDKPELSRTGLWLIPLSPHTTPTHPVPGTTGTSLNPTEPWGGGATHSVWMRMSLFLGSSTHLQMSSWVTGMAMWLDTHRSER